MLVGSAGEERVNCGASDIACGGEGLMKVGVDLVDCFGHSVSEIGLNTCDGDIQAVRACLADLSQESLCAVRIVGDKRVRHVCCSWGSRLGGKRKRWQRDSTHLCGK